MDLEAVRRFRFEPVVRRYDWRDTALYALSLGYGSDPLDEDALPFVFEDEQRAVPSQCVVLGHPGFWLKAPELGIDWVKVLHGEQSFQMHQALPPQGCVRSEHRVLSVEDKGSGKGAILVLEKRLSDEESQRPLAIVHTTVFLRGDGGSGSFGENLPALPSVPNGKIDHVVEIATLPQAALLYRLNGDVNPVHAVPSVARAAGFERPILHGLCTMGFACRAVLRAFCGNRPERLLSMAVRFSRPVFPGETIRVECVASGDLVQFRAKAVERDTVVLDRGTAKIAS